MTEQERLSRETLLKRAAALAGAAYTAPVVSSSALAETAACSGICKKGKKGKKKCKKAGGRLCRCPAAGGVCDDGDPCLSNCLHSDIACSPLQACPGCGGNGACFAQSNGIPTGCNSSPNQGLCIDLRDGLCASFTPCGADGSCGAGECCFSSCCDCMFGFPPLCSTVCTGSTPPRARTRRATKGPHV